MSKEQENEVLITREDMQNAYNSYADAKNELESVKAKIKEAKKEIDDDFKDQLESLETELVEFEGILSRYNNQNNVKSTSLPNGGWFGNKETEAFEIDKEKDFVDALVSLKKQFPTNWDKLVTGYPKLKVVEVRNFIKYDFLTDEIMEQIGIVTTKDVTFDVKLPK